MQISKILSYLDSLSIEYTFEGKDSQSILSAQSIQKATHNQFCYLAQAKLVKQIADCQAGLLISNKKFCDDIDNNINNFLWVHNPHYVFAKIMQLFYPEDIYQIGVSEFARVSESARLSESTAVEENALIHAGVKIGKNTLVKSGAIVHPGVEIGDNCMIGNHVVIHKDCVIGNDVRIESGAIIGGDGFGWAFDHEQWHKIPQIGRVRIGDRVSIGNNVCIDRGAIDDTVIENDVIIDNLVHVAHNVAIRKGSAIAAQAGFAGSTKIGEFNTVAGQAGFAGHIETADQCHFHAKSGVTHTIKKAGVYAGFPAYEARKWQRNTVKSQKIEEFSKKIKQMQKKLDALIESLEESS